MSLSLTKLLSQSGEFLSADRLEKATAEIEGFSKTICNASAKYNSLKKDEIEEGTKKRQLLITDGIRQGKKEEDVMKEVGRFIPCRQTPILNWLYFLLQENYDQTFENTRVELNQKHGHLWETYEPEKEYMRECQDVDEFVYGNATHKQFQTIKKLKTLALGSECNENESALAFSMCKDMCRKLGLEFDKIPINNK